ncbi:MAG: hypothetical protein ACWA41_08730 [Putridiphycobacter sp.]
MSSADVFYGIKDGMYWLFEKTLEPIGDLFWEATLIFGFVAFAYWMYRQVQFNKEAENDPNQIK